MGYRISVDTGGTFTDVVVVDESGRQVIGKALTTHQRIFEGMRGGLEVAAGLLETDLSGLLSRADLLIYGTTRATNAIVEGKTAKTAFLTTEGFPDILTLREGGRTNVHNFTREYPGPYVPRNRTFEVPERMDAEGGIVRPLDEGACRTIIGKLSERGIEAVGVCLLWSVANPAHELRVAELLAELLPGVPYTLSHQLLPIVREYRRASATVIDASLKPLMQAHLHGMESDLREAGFTGDLMVSSSVGGCMQVALTAAEPINTVKSGPAMAPVAARTYSSIERFGGDAIVCDTGGTTFDVGLVRDGSIVHTRETWLGEQFTGFLIATSTVDIRSIGAGGGSIAWVDPGGLLQVGPQSAGSEPGPACYGRGGELPTVTDAAAVLGYLDPETFLGGRMALDIPAARRAIAGVADQLGKTAEDTAWAIMKITDELMIKAIHEITVAEGFNPGESAIVAGGGAAGLNIMPIAADLGIEKVVLPKMAGALSAVGMQYADIVAEEAGSLITSTDDFDRDGVNRVFDSLERGLEKVVDALEGMNLQEPVISTLVEARYVGQVWEIEVPLDVARFDSESDVRSLVEAFHQVHDRIYAVTDPDSAVECLNWKKRVSITLQHPKTDIGKAKLHEARQATRQRTCHFGTGEGVDTPIYHGDALRPGAQVRGPAIIEEPTTTLVVYPGMAAHVSGAGNYILSVTD